MRIFSLLTLLTLAVSAPLAAMDHEDHGKGVTATPMNTECPMCDKAIGDKPTMVKITVGEGKDAKVCHMACDSKDCAAAFVKDPEPALKKKFGKDAPGPKTLNK